ncbi:unnamed protein product, partial [Oikopleura dioica]
SLDSDGQKKRHRRSRSFSRRRSRSSSYESGSRHRLKDRDSIYESRASFRDRENPRASNVLGVFNLGRDFPECELRRLFQKYGRIKACNLVYDKKYRESRGFGFVTFANIDDAIYAKKDAEGLDISRGRHSPRPIRIDYSLTQRAHSPTPGVFMGDPRKRHSTNRSRSRRRSRSRSRQRSKGRKSRSRSRQRRRKRSRSRSYSRTRSRRQSTIKFVKRERSCSR